jgi:hypothetical protein
MLARKKPFRCHSFELACAQLDIEHRLTKPRHPWTNGQVERMNRTIKDATVKRFHYSSHDQLRVHLADFLDAYNFARRLKTLRGLTPFEAICKAWTEEPHRFKLNPLHQMPGLNIKLGDEPVPGVAASVNDGGVVLEDTQAEKALAQIKPDPFDGIKLWTVRRQRDEGDVGRHLQRLGAVPTRGPAPTRRERLLARCG